MSLFALTLAHGALPRIAVAVEILFWIYVPVSFVYVSGYVTKKCRAGRLLENGKTPPPWNVTRSSAWLFILCVLGLLFIQSPWYMVMVVMGVSLYLLENQRTAREQFGLERLSFSKLVTWSILICGAVILVEVPLTEIINETMTLFHVPHPEQESVETFRHYGKASDVMAFLLQAVIISPMIEEIFFRGFLFTFLKNYTSTWLALILSAGVFAFAHVNLGSAISLWFLGVVLGIAYQHTGSLLLPICIHGCFNLMTALSLLLDKGTS